MARWRSLTNEYPDGMEQKDHVLRLARGAMAEGLSLQTFLFGLMLYVEDENAIDRQPLLGWWYQGGAPAQPGHEDRPATLPEPEDKNKHAGG